MLGKRGERRGRGFKSAEVEQEVVREGRGQRIIDGNERVAIRNAHNTEYQTLLSAHPKTKGPQELKK